MRLLPARATLFGLVFALSASTAFAQQATVPFDMSGERGPTIETKPATDGGNTAVETKVPEKKAETPDPGLRRYIIPATSLLLEGEAASRSFPVYLTPQQAEAATSINLGYSNAVVVAPEVSTLSVVVNDVAVGEMPVQSAEGTKDVQFNLPAGLLRPGVNRVTFNAVQRHRTDCTIRSTYDLWTALDPARTYLTVPRDDSGRLLTTDDIAAIGLGPTGQTKFTMVVPEMGQPAATNALMRLSQGLALMAKMPNQTFDVVETLPAAARSSSSAGRTGRRSRARWRAWSRPSTGRSA